MHENASNHMILGCDIYNDTFIQTNADTLFKQFNKANNYGSRGKHLAI